MIKLKFLGATETVTGSKYLLTVDQQKILVDCGLFQGPKALRERNWQPMPVDPKSIQAVVLTHAHVDHSGYLPLLVRQGFRGPIYCTEATFDLCKILLPDSGHLQEEDAKYAVKHGFSRHHPPLPLYTREDALVSLKQFRTLPYGTPFQILKEGREGVVSFHHAGHILGASFVQFEIEGVKILFSGDIGRPHDALMNAPAILQQTDYLVMESTYGDRLHDAMDPKEELGAIIEATVQKGGSVLIPAFAVGRAQAILHHLLRLKQEGRIPNVPIFLDSPMAISATGLLCKYANEHHLSKSQCAAVSQLPIYANTIDESKAISSNPLPKIIVSASGMLSGGRSVHHLKQLVSDNRNTIVLAGFQTPETRGARLMVGDREIKIHGEMFAVKARIESLSNTSAHSDYQEILMWLKHFTHAPRMTFITHGETHAAQAMKGHVESELHWPVQVPRYLDEVVLG